MICPDRNWARLSQWSPYPANYLSLVLCFSRIARLCFDRCRSSRAQLGWHLHGPAPSHLRVGLSTHLKPRNPFWCSTTTHKIADAAIQRIRLRGNPPLSTPCANWKPFCARSQTFVLARDAQWRRPDRNLHPPPAQRPCPPALTLRWCRVPHQSRLLPDRTITTRSHPLLSCAVGRLCPVAGARPRPV